MAQAPKKKTPAKRTSRAKAPASKAEAPEARRADPALATIVTPGTPARTAAAASPAVEAPAATVEEAARAASAAIAPTTTDTPAKADVEATKASGFLPLVLGGVVAGGLGFGIATYLEDQSAGAPVDTGRIDALAAEIETLKGMEAATFDPSTIEAAQSALSDRLDDLVARVDALEADVVAAPDGVGTPDAATTPGDGAQTAAPVVAEADLSALRTELDGLGSEISTLREDLTPRVAALEETVVAANTLAQSVEEQARQQARDTAANQLRLALQSGAPYADQLDILGDAPEALVASATTGVPAQTALIEAFPELSREALRAARAAAPATGMGSLFQNAFNPRSLEPREGDDPDAVLSRAEAAVRDGDLDTALGEIEALPPEAQAVLDPWTARARARAAALTAAETYLQDE